MSQDIEVLIKLDIATCKEFYTQHRQFNRDAFLPMPQKCGEWPYLFATIVANEKILFADIDERSLNKYKGKLGCYESTSNK